MIDDKRILDFLDSEYAIDDILYQRIKQLSLCVVELENKKDEYLQLQKYNLFDYLQLITNEVDKSYKHVIINLLLKRFHDEFR